MKLPYRAGDYFALPLGDGSFARAQIVRARHHVVDVAVDGHAVRTIDRALVLRRWRGFGHGAVLVDGEPSNLASVWTPAHAERFFAGREWAPLVIHEGRFTPDYACARDDDELRVLAARGVESLVIAGRVRVETIAALFPRLRALRIAVRDMCVDARDLVYCSSLEVLDCSGVTLAHAETLAGLTRLGALRIARVRAFDVRRLDGVRAAALAFESIGDLRDVRALATREDLVQLELLDLWPCELGDVMPLVDLPNLIRAEIDIGGRRKNVELYRRANWAYPFPLTLT